MCRNSSSQADSTYGKKEKKEDQVACLKTDQKMPYLVAPFSLNK